MKSIFILLMALIAFSAAIAQYTFVAYIKDLKTEEPIIGAIVNLCNTMIMSTAV